MDLSDASKRMGTQDEAAFDAHPKLPHMARFLGLAPELVTHPVKGIRTKQIA
jgi:hypothetical protein